MNHESKILNVRTLAVAFWASYFALHWLLLLEVIEPTWQRFGATLFFFLTAVVLSGAQLVGTPQKRGGGNGRK